MKSLDGESLVPPAAVAAVAERFPEATSWLESLPELINEYAARWRLTVLPPFCDGGGGWKAPVLLEDRSPAVLKLAVPSERHGYGAAEALRVWNGRGAVRLLAYSAQDRAMLLERCIPGTTLESLPLREANLALAGLFRQLWVIAPDPSVFTALTERTAGDLTVERLRTNDVRLDSGFLREIRAFDDLAAPRPTDRLLLGDLGRGNVLLSARGWLAIDPSPVVGDPAYDVARAIVQRGEYADLATQIALFAEELGLDSDRIGAWVCAETAGALGWYVHVGDVDRGNNMLEHLRQAIAAHSRSVGPAG